MNTAAATAAQSFTYMVDVVATDCSWHRITVQSPRHQGVKAAARKIAKARGIEVKFINSMFLAS